MKVLFTFAGLPHYYNPILNRLNAVKGVEIHVLVPSKKSSVIGEGVHQSKAGIEFTVHYLEEYSTYYGKKFFRGFLHLLKIEKPDIVITAWPYELAFVLYPWLMPFFRRNGIKLMLKENPFQIPRYDQAKKFYRTANLFSEEPDSEDISSKPSYAKYMIATWLRKQYYGVMDGCVTYIDDAFDIMGSYGVPKEKIFVTYNSPDTDVLLRVNDAIGAAEPILPVNPFRIIHIGRLVYWKRVDLLLRAVAALRSEFPRIELVVVGDGPQKEQLIALAKKSGIESLVNFIGSVYEPEKLGRLLKVSSLYVLAGMGGLSINEAMCFGKPVVCSVCDGTEKKLVRENYNGKYFREGDERDLSKVLKQLLSDPALLQTMGMRSLEIIRNEVNVHTVIDGYLRAFSYVTQRQFAQ